MKFAFVFPGQGSQTIGMLSEFSGETVVRETFSQASSLLGYDLWEFAQTGPEERMALTTNTQPLIYTASCALWRLWCETTQARPAFVAGHSLGEYAALFAAQAFDFATGLELIAFRARAMQEAFPEGRGAMAAVIGLDPATIVETLKGIEPTVEAVNFNSPQQVVIAGFTEAIDAAEEALRAKGAKRVLRLKVSGPFHSSLMQKARLALESRLPVVKLAAPAIAVVQNVNARPTLEAGKLKAGLGEQMVAPVLWEQTVHALAAEGVQACVECGPGKVLSNLMRRTEPALAVYTTESQASFAAATEALS